MIILSGQKNVVASDILNLHLKRINERDETNNKDDDALQLSKQFDEPLYFNFTEENAMSWRDYIDICE